MHTNNIRSMLPTLKTIEQLSVIFASLIVSVVSCNYDARQLATERYKLYREASIEMITNIQSIHNFNEHLWILINEYKKQKDIKILHKITLRIHTFQYKYNMFDILTTFPQDVSITWTEFTDTSLAIVNKYTEICDSATNMTDEELTNSINEIEILNQQLNKIYKEIINKNNNAAQKYIKNIIN